MYRDDSNENKRSKLCIRAVESLREREKGEGGETKNTFRESHISSSSSPASGNDTNFAFKGNQARRGRRLALKRRHYQLKPEMEQASRREGDRGTWSSHGTQEKWRMEEAQGKLILYETWERERGCWTSGVDGGGAGAERRVLLKTAAVLCCTAVLSFALQACGYSSLLSKEENI
jgi:hypothetical protein